jgi:hypothetical protein
MTCQFASSLSKKALTYQPCIVGKKINTSGLNMSKISSSDKWSSEEKFAVVLETATLSPLS